MPSSCKGKTLTACAATSGCKTTRGSPKRKSYCRTSKNKARSPSRARKPKTGCPALTLQSCAQSSTCKVVEASRKNKSGKLVLYSYCRSRKRASKKK